MFTGVCCGSILKIIQTMAGPVKSVDQAVWVFRLFPTFSFASGMSSLYAVAFYNAFCESVPSYDLQFHCNSPTMEKSNPLFKCCKGSYKLFVLICFLFINNKIQFLKKYGNKTTITIKISNFFLMYYVV